MLVGNFDRRGPLAAAYLWQRASPARRHEAGPNERRAMGLRSPEGESGEGRKRCLDAAPRCAILKLRREDLAFQKVNREARHAGRVSGREHFLPTRFLPDCGRGTFAALAATAERGRNSLTSGSMTYPPRERRVRARLVGCYDETGLACLSFLARAQLDEVANSFAARD